MVKLELTEKAAMALWMGCNQLLKTHGWGVWDLCEELKPQLKPYLDKLEEKKELVQENNTE